MKFEIYKIYLSLLEAFKSVGNMYSKILEKY